jgi:hypothetical protein
VVIPTYRTNRLEETILALDAAYNRVMVRAIHIVERPIRVRVKLLEKIRPFLGRNDPAFDAEFARWQIENGTIINYRHYRPNLHLAKERRYQDREPRYAYDACLLAECPLSVEDIERTSVDAESLLVIFRPPVWRAHEELLFTLFPTGKACKRFIQIVSASKATKELLAVAQACGIPTAGAWAMNDDVLRKELGVNIMGQKAIQSRAMRHFSGRRYCRVIQLIPRVEPEDHTLYGMYEFIRNELPRVGNVCLAKDSILSKSVRFWKVALRALVRSGCVEQKARTSFYFLDGLQPDYDKIEAEHAAAAAKLAQVISMVDNLKEYGR